MQLPAGLAVLTGVANGTCIAGTEFLITPNNSGVANGTCITGTEFFKLTPNNSGVANGTCITGTEFFKVTPKNLKRDTILGEATLGEAILEGKE